MGISIRLTPKEFGDLLYLPLGGLFDEKGHYNSTLFSLSGSASKLNIHDRVLYLILTWNLRLIKKHAKLRNTDYWSIDCFKSDRCPNFALIMFNDITKAIGRGINTNVTLPHGSYFSYRF